MAVTRNGGPAFPNVENPLDPPERGMSLRDYFAAAAMQGMFGDAEVLTVMGKGPLTKAEEIAQAAYTMADAMLEERKK